MRIEISEERDDSLRFILRDASVAFANSLRRAMIAEVPTMAIDDVIIIENSTVMYDEILAHRLGLIPLTTDLDAYVPREECDCRSELGCGRCTASFTLEAEAVDHTITVYSRDLRSDSDVRPVSGDIPLVKLAPTQRLKLEAYARLGRGAEHSKWQPVTVCAYKYLPKVDLYPENLANPEEVIKVCPRDVYDHDQVRKIVVRDELACTLCMDCAKLAKPLDPKKPFPVKIEWDEKAFIFHIESTGALPPRRIVEEASRILGRKAAELAELVAT